MTKRAFTLLEVAVSMALMIVVVGVVMGFLVQVLAGNKRQQTHNELLRDGALVSQFLNSELRQAGLGVPVARTDNCTPTGLHIRKALVAGNPQPTYGTVTTDPLTGLQIPSSFYASVIVAASQQVGIVGDLPLPDQQYSTYGPLHGRTAFLPTDIGVNTAEAIMWHNENNGSCAPGNGCTLANTSTFFQDGGDICTTGNMLARTCPWGMGRARAGDRIQIVAGDGTWSHAAVANPVAGVALTGGRMALKLNPGFDLNDSAATWVTDGVWGNRSQPLSLAPLQRGGPGDIRGAGWLTTLDRVFFFFDSADNTIKRIQCTGDPDPNNTGWPDATATAIPGLPGVGSLQFTPPATAPTTAAANVCVGPEIIARNVASVTFSYFDRVGGAIAAPVTGVGTCTVGRPPTYTGGKTAIRRIDYVINFQKQFDSDPTHIVKHTVEGSVRLQNL